MTALAHRLLTRLAILAAAFASLLAISPAAMAACSSANLTSAPTNVAIGNYNPFTSSINTTVVYTITNTGTACSMNFTLQRATSAVTKMTLASPASTLNYSVSASGVTAVSITGNVPSAGQFVALGTLATNQTVTVTATFSVPVGQVVAAGGYTDTLTPTLFDASNGARATFPSQTVTATVLAVCSFVSAPTAANLDFSSAISNGTANAGSIQTDSVPNAQCTAPTRIQLSGNSLQTSPLGTAVGGFDNFINWTATATMGSATATLTTTGLAATPAVTSAAKNTATAGPITGTIAISNVHLLAANPILAGAYISSLTIQIDPSL